MWKLSYLLNLHVLIPIQVFTQSKNHLSVESTPCPHLNI